jgi:hypothetical protein
LIRRLPIQIDLQQGNLAEVEFIEGPHEKMDFDLEEVVATISTTFPSIPIT